MAGLCAGSLAAILAEIEELKASADALESELSDASKAAEAAAKRSRRLAARSHELQVCVCRQMECILCILCVFLGGGAIAGAGGRGHALCSPRPAKQERQQPNEAGG